MTSNANETAHTNATLSRILTVVALVAAAILWIATAHNGVGMSADGVHYVSAARSLLAGHGLVRYDGQLYAQWPPLYPLLLAAAGWTGLDMMLAARLLNVVSFALLAYFTGRMLSVYLRSRMLILIGIGWVLFSVPLLESFTMAWSDPLFFLLVLGGLWAFAKYERNARTVDFAWMIVATAAACVQRYVGIALLLTLGGLILTRCRQISPIERAKRALLFGVLSVIPLAAWMIRNVVEAGSATGPRFPAQFSLAKNTHDVVNLLTVWMLPSALPVMARVIIVLLMMAGAYWVIRSAHQRGVTAGGSKADFVPVMAFAAVYLGFVFVMAHLTHVDEFSWRYLGPIYVPVVMIFMVAAQRLLDSIDGARTRTVVVVLMSLWLLYPISWTARRAHTWYFEGTGFYETPRWVHSPTLDWVRQHAGSATILSNSPETIYARSGLCIRKTPEIQSGRNDLPRMLGVDGGFVVWFKDLDDCGLYSLSEIANSVDMSVLTTFSDGTIYRVKARS